MVIVSITSMCNQERNAKRIAEGYVACTRKPDLCVFVLDRTTDNTQLVLELAFHGTGVKFVVLKAPWNDAIFAAGRPRDWAIDQVRDYLMPSVNCFVFLDGDCIPSPELFAEHERVHGMAFPYPCLVNGARHDEDVNGKTLPDPRQANPCVMSSGLDVVICTPENLYVDQTACIPACWGCNVSLNIAAIETARSINRLLLGDIDRAFASCFDGNWGGEDPFLAATLFRVNCLLVTVDPDRSWVDHIWHDGSHRTNKHAGVLHAGLRRFRAMLSRLVLCTPRTLFTMKPNTTGTSIDAPYLVKQAVRAFITETKSVLPEHAVVLQLSRILCADSKESVDTVFRYKRAYQENVVSQHVFKLSDFAGIGDQKYTKPTSCTEPFCYWLTYSANALC